MTRFPLKFLVPLVFTIFFGSSAFAECSIPTESNDWGATCEQGTSPFNQRDFASQCFYSYETQCYNENDQTACDDLNECIRESAVSVFGDG